MPNQLTASDRRRREPSDDSYSRTLNQKRLTYRDVSDSSDDKDLRLEYSTANPVRDLINVVQKVGKQLAPYTQRFRTRATLIPEPVAPRPSAPLQPSARPTRTPRTSAPKAKKFTEEVFSPTYPTSKPRVNTVPVIVPAHFENKLTKQPVSAGVESFITKRPYLVDYIVGDKSNSFALVPQHTESKGTYYMSKTAKSALSNMPTRASIPRNMPKRSGALSNVFRGTNVSTTRNAPAAISRRMNVVSKPKFSTSSKGIVVRHREYMSNILSNATTLSFNAIGLTLNPGKVAAFPWLSTIAVNFDKYRILSCTISLVTNQPTTTAGRVGVGFDYDSTDPVPDDRTDFFSLTHHAECAAWDSLDFKIPLQGGVRFVNTHTATDSKLIDYGQVIIMADQIATTGTAINLGDVIIDYAVELIDPQQAVMLTYGLVGDNPATFSEMVPVGPAFAEQVATTSTTVLQHRLAIGYYQISVVAWDAGGASPTITANYTTGTAGKQSGVGTTTIFNYTALVHILKDESLFEITVGGVTIVNMETLYLSITRISPSVFTRNFVTALWPNTVPNTL